MQSSGYTSWNNASWLFGLLCRLGKKKKRKLHGVMQLRTVPAVQGSSYPLRQQIFLSDIMAVANTCMNCSHTFQWLQTRSRTALRCNQQNILFFSVAEWPANCAKIIFSCNCYEKVFGTDGSVPQRCKCRKSQLGTYRICCRLWVFYQTFSERLFFLPSERTSPPRHVHRTKAWYNPGAITSDNYISWFTTGHMTELTNHRIMHISISLWDFQQHDISS